MEKFAETCGDFALNLFKGVSSDERNSLLSPASITMALAMTYAGADGNTKSQMNDVIFAGLSDEEINESCNEIVTIINNPTDAYVLRAANRLYLEKSYVVLQSFLDVVQKHFQSDCIASDFTGNPQEVRHEINGLVEQATDEKIKDLLPIDAVDENTCLILVNAIYFKGDWLKPFDEEETEKKSFSISSSETMEVDMMHAKLPKTFKFNSTEDCQVLGIPYKSDDLVMYFILPRERNALREFEKGLTGRTLIELLNNANTAEVEVQLPKFKLEQSFDLVVKLTNLGISDMFKSEADFSKISGCKDLRVSQVVHQAFIEINEKGSEAAAATAVVMSRCAEIGIQREHSFIADHPFLFVLFERKTNLILFLGHYYGQ